MASEPPGRKKPCVQRVRKALRYPCAWRRQRFLNHVAGKAFLKPLRRRRDRDGNAHAISKGDEHGSSTARSHDPPARLCDLGSRKAVPTAANGTIGSGPLREIVEPAPPRRSPLRAGRTARAKTAAKGRIRAALKSAIVVQTLRRSSSPPGPLGGPFHAAAPLSRPPASARIACSGHSSMMTLRVRLSRIT